MRAAWIVVALGATSLGACHLVSGLDAFVLEETGGGGAGSVGGGGAGGQGGVGGQGGEGTGGAGGGVLPCTAPGTTDVPCTGEVLWSKRMSSAEGDTFFRAVSVAPDGSIYVGGYTVGLATFEGDTFGETGEAGFFMKLDQDGNLIWRRQVTGNNYQIVTSLAATPDGGVMVAGEFWDEVVLEGGPTFDNLATDTEDSYLTHYDANGNHIWSNHVDGDDSERIRNLAVDATGRVVVVGEFQVEAQIPGGPLLTEAGNTNGPAHQVFVAMRDAGGGHLWANGYGSDQRDQEAFAALFTSDGNVVVGGDFRQTIDFGLGALGAMDGQDAFLVKLEADNDGAALWQTWVKGDAAEHLRGLDTCPDGSLAVSGTFDATLVVDDGPAHGAIDDDIWHARLTSEGKHIASDSLSGTADDIGYYHMIRCDPDGHLVLAGTFDSTLFGADPMGNQDAFVAKLDDEGGVFWIQRFGSDGFEQAKNLTLTADGSILASGNFDKQITLGTDLYSIEGGGEDAFLVKLAP